MKKVLIHPLSQLIIRENCLVGFEGQMNLDKLDKELRFKATKYKADDVTHEELLEMHKGKYGIPEKGWIELFISEDMKIEEIWKQAMAEV